MQAKIVHMVEFSVGFLWHGTARWLAETPGMAGSQGCSATACVHAYHYGFAHWSVSYLGQKQKNYTSFKINVSMHQ